MNLIYSECKYVMPSVVSDARHDGRVCWGRSGGEWEAVGVEKMGVSVINSY